MTLSNSPALNQIEVSLFGPGFGESLVIHLGGGDWIIVDSCDAENRDYPAPLLYLEALGVNLANSVKLVVATHWHDDHVRGMSNVYRVCKNARFAFPAALTGKEFVKLIELYKGQGGQSPSGVDEFSYILYDLAKCKRNGVSRFKRAAADTRLLTNKVNLGNAQLIASVDALSPSDEAVMAGQMAFANLFEGSKKRSRRLPAAEPNRTSVALWVRVGEHRLLLGADLETAKGNPKTGWTVILDQSQVIDGKASVFKVPHHGSQNAHDTRVWEELLTTEAVAILTPFWKGDVKLPSNTDEKRIIGMGRDAYITASNVQKDPDIKDRVVRDTVAEATRSIRRLHPQAGHVRLRSNLHAPFAWKVELFGGARALTSKDDSEPQ